MTIATTGKVLSVQRLTLWRPGLGADWLSRQAWPLLYTVPRCRRDWASKRQWTERCG